MEPIDPVGSVVTTEQLEPIRDGPDNSGASNHPLLPLESHATTNPVEPNATDNVADENVRLAQELANETYKRRMRKRTYAQLFPYSTEMAQYKIQVRSSGIRPTRVVDMNDTAESDPTVQFEQRPPPNSSRPRNANSRSGGQSRRANSAEPLGWTNAQAGKNAITPPSATQFGRRIVPDSEDETDKEATNSHNKQHLYFSDSEDDVAEQSFARSPRSDDWDPFANDSSSSEEELPLRKGAIPATFIRELLEDDPLVAERDSRPTQARPSPQRKGIAIQKKRAVESAARRDNFSQTKRTGSRQQLGSSAIPDIEVTQVIHSKSLPMTEVEVTHVKRNSAPKNQYRSALSYSYTTQEKQTDIRDFGDFLDGAEEHDEIDHMVSRSYNTGRKSKRLKKPRSSNPSGTKQSVAVSRNRVTSEQSTRRKPSSSKPRASSQRVPAQRYSGSVVHTPSQTFGAHQVAFPGLATITRDRQNTPPLQNVQQETAQEKPKLKPKRYARPVAVVSGLHGPRNKPRVYSSTFQVESGAYVPRLPPKPRRRIPKVAEFPVQAFSTGPGQAERPTERQILTGVGDQSNLHAFTQDLHNSNPIANSHVFDHGMDSRLGQFLESAVEEHQFANTGAVNGARHPLDLELTSDPHITQESHMAQHMHQGKNQSETYAQAPSEAQFTKNHLDHILKGQSFSFDFETYPLNSSVQFEETSFVGQGTFEHILKGTSTPLQSDSWSGYFGSEIGLLNWNALDASVLDSFESSCKTILLWISSQEDVITNEQIETNYFYWKFVNDFFSHKISLARTSVNSSDNFASRMVGVVENTIRSIMSTFNSVTEKKDNWSELCATSLIFSMTLFVPLYRHHKATASSVPFLFTKTAKTVLKHLFSRFNEIFAKLKFQRSLKTHPKLTRSSYVEFAYMCVHLLDTGSNLMGTAPFFQIMGSCIKASLAGKSVIEKNEVIWQTAFLFNTFYLMRDETNRAPPGGWDLVKSLTIPIFDEVRQSKDGSSLGTSSYVKSLLARCLILQTTWNWEPDRETIKAAYNLFANIRYANLEPNDVGHKLPDFLMKASASSSITHVALEDTVFTVFLKLLSVSILSFKKTSAKQLRRLVDAVNVLNSFSYPPRDAEIQVVELESLANQYSLLLTRYKYSSKTAQPPLEQLVGLFTIDNSHLKARELTVDAWKVVVEIQISRNQQLTSAMKWYDQLLGKALDEYLHLDKVKGPTNTHLPKREYERRKTHLEAYQMFLSLPLLHVEKLLANKDALVKSVHWETLMRKLFTKLLSSSVPETLQSIALSILQLYISSAQHMLTAETPEYPASNVGLIDEDSQALDFVIPNGNLQRKELVAKFAHRYSEVVPVHFYKEFLRGLMVDTNTCSDAFVRKAIVIWADTAQFLVANNEVEWRVFFYSWQWFGQSKRLTTYEPFWLSEFLKVCGTYYLEEETKFLEDFMKYLVCVHPVYEPHYAIALLARKPVIFQKFETEFAALTRSNFTQMRLIILQCVIRELGTLASNPSKSNLVGLLMASLTNNMKLNTKKLDFRNENGYMDFVHQVIDWIFQFCPLTNIEWFMNPETFPPSRNGEEQVSFKTARFKKMLQIEFSNEYAAGFKLVHFFCLELQESAVARNRQFQDVMTAALSPEMVGGLFSDPNGQARQFILRAFITPYIIEAGKSQAAKLFLDPVLDTAASIFKIQYEVGVLPENESAAVGFLESLLNLVWINLEDIVNSFGQNKQQDYSLWKCINSCFAIAEYLVQAYIQQPTLPISDACASCLTKLIDLAMSISVYLVSDLPNLVPEHAFAEYNPFGRGVTDPETGHLAFYKLIQNSFMGQVRYDDRLEQWEEKGRVVKKNGLDMKAMKSEGQERVFRFLQAVSYLSNPSALTGKNEVLTHLWGNHEAVIKLMSEQQGSRLRHLAMLNTRPVGDDKDELEILSSGFSELAVEEPDANQRLAYRAGLNDDVIF